MTKATMKNNFAKINKEVTHNKMVAYDSRFRQLQTMCEKYGDGNKWCSAQMCLEEIIKNSPTNAHVIAQAFQLYNEMQEYKAKFDMLTATLEATNNFE